MIRVVWRVVYEIFILVLVQSLQPAFLHCHVPLSGDVVVRDVVIYHHVRCAAADIPPVHEIFVDVVMVSIDGEQVAAELHHVVLPHRIRAVPSYVMEPIAE